MSQCDRREADRLMLLTIFLAFLGVVVFVGVGCCAGWVFATSGEMRTDEVEPRSLETDNKPKPTIRLAAVVRCKGFGPDIASERYLYDGLASCKLAHNTAGGFKACTAGCLSLGDCARACAFDALHMDGLAPVVDLSKCNACGACVVACPRTIIALVPMQPQHMVNCVSHQSGTVILQDCSVGCTACEKCIKVCEYDAIVMNDNLAVINPEKCVACGACAKVCPPQVIDYVDSIS